MLEWAAILAVLDQIKSWFSTQSEKMEKFKPFLKKIGPYLPTIWTIGMSFYLLILFYILWQVLLLKAGN